jgi:YrbI family 3-deoxy-D-manno-octulosonate 8-phosphate phosphatase
MSKQMEGGPSLEARCQAVELILADVDGVLTDGRVVINNQGVETKQFHIRDGMGIRLWQKAGYRFGLVTLRSSQVVKMRAAELDVSIVRQGASDKRATVLEIAGELGLAPSQTCYIGDDLPDLPAVAAVGLGVAVADACPELLEAAHYVAALPGGSGAVREVIELILKAQGRWEEAIQPYRG